MASFNLPAMHKLDLSGDATLLSSKWLKWKRAFHIVLTASEIIDDNTKLATLLHTGGIGLQEIYYSLVPTQLPLDIDTNVYDYAIEKLDNYFIGKNSIFLDRYIFRKIHQLQNERFEHFLSRLQKQAIKCQFANCNENLIDQVIEKCFNIEFRKKILLLPNDEINLENIILLAKSFESVNRQISSEIKKEQLSINIKKKNINETLNTNRTFQIRNSRKCRRCGNFNHSSDYINCPALNKRCSKCTYLGHFREFCHTKQFNFSNSKYYSRKDVLKSKKFKVPYS